MVSLRTSLDSSIVYPVLFHTPVLLPAFLLNTCLSPPHYFTTNISLSSAIRLPPHRQSAHPVPSSFKNSANTPKKMVSPAFVSALTIGARPSPVGRSSLCGARLSSSPVASGATVRMAEASPSVPFLPKPKNLKENMIGYTGFDPFALSELMDIKWLQQSEIKHGRVCMLAFLGMLVQEFVQLPNEMYSNPLATQAFFQVPSAAIWQIFLFCGICEMVGHRGKVAYTDMFSDGAVPGELGFNPMGLKYDDRMKLAEIKNGRLAMCGVGGVIHSMLLYKVPIVYQLTHFEPMKVNL